MDDLEKAICKKFKVKQKKISDKMILDILECLSKYDEIRIIDCESCICAYSTLVEIGDPVRHGDEEFPGNQGFGWSLREAILGSLLSDKIKEDTFAYDDIRYLLLSYWEKVKEMVV